MKTETIVCCPTCRRTRTLIREADPLLNYYVSCNSCGVDPAEPWEACSRGTLLLLWVCIVLALGFVVGVLVYAARHFK